MNAREEHQKAPLSSLTPHGNILGGGLGISRKIIIRCLSLLQERIGNIKKSIFGHGRLLITKSFFPSD